jgi:hypothetical protein
VAGSQAFVTAVESVGAGVTRIELGCHAEAQRGIVTVEDLDAVAAVRLGRFAAEIGEPTARRACVTRARGTCVFASLTCAAVSVATSPASAGARAAVSGATRSASAGARATVSVATRSASAGAVAAVRVATSPASADGRATVSGAATAASPLALTAHTRLVTPGVAGVAGVAFGVGPGVTAAGDGQDNAKHGAKSPTVSPHAAQSTTVARRGLAHC